MLLILIATAVKSNAQEQLKIKIYNQTNVPTLPTNSFQRIAVDGQGFVWIGTNGQGLVRLNPVDSSSQVTLPTHQVRAIIRDSKGDILVGSGVNGVQATLGGIRKFNQGWSIPTQTGFWGSADNLPSRFVHGLEEGPGNTIWSAHGQTLVSTTTTEGGVGLFYGAEWTKIPLSNNTASQEGMPSSDRRVLSIARNGQTIWAGVDRSCNNGICAAPYIAEYSSTGQYIRKVSGELPFNDAAGTPVPRAIFTDKKGRTWVGFNTGTSVVAVYENSTSKWNILPNTTTKLPANTAVNFNSIREDGFGNIWLGTNNGLIKFGGSDYTDTANWTLFTTSNGLPSNFISGIAFDNLGNKWISTSNGIAKISDVLLLDPTMSLTNIINENDGSIKNDVNAIVDISKVKDAEKIGVSADGVTKLIIVIKSSAALNFSLLSTKDGFLSTLDAQDTKVHYASNVKPIKTSTGEELVIVLYTAPESYGTEHALKEDGRGVKINVTQFGDFSPMSELQVKVFTPPVVMVHGMWSSPNVWKEGGFEDYLRNAEFSNIELANYQATNAETFDPTLPANPGPKAVKEAIDEAIKKYKEKGIGASQVDVVAHSLGGLMTRSLSQQNVYKNKINYYQGLVHKLITIGTPHQGSPLGGILWDGKEVLLATNDIGQTFTIADLFKITGQPVGTCHRDFKPGSIAYQNLTTTNIKSHAIVASYKPILTNSYGLLSFAIEALTNQLYNKRQTLDEVFNDDHDLIVSLTSQYGGLQPGATSTTFFNGTVHATIRESDKTETNSKPIQERAKHLLLSNDENLFATQFPAPLANTDNRISSQMNSSSENVKLSTNSFNTSSIALIESTQRIKIISPVSGSTYPYSTSTTITLELETFGGTILEGAIFMVEGIGMLEVPTTQPHKVSFQLPRTSPIGKINVAALAKDVTGLLMADTASIVIQINTPISSISVNPNPVNLTSTKPTLPLFVSGIIYNGVDSISVNITSSSTGTYYKAMKGNTVVNVSENGSISAISVGTDIIEVINGNTIITVPVTVSSICSVPKPTIAQNGNILTSSIASGNQWYLNNSAISGATSNTYEAALPGSYTVQVTAECTGPMSDAVIIKPEEKQSQTITFSPLADKTFGDPAFTLNATASSGLPVSFSVVSGTATLSGSTLTITGAGTITVRASQAGNENYSAADNVERSFCVVPSKPTISKQINVLSSSSQVGNQWYLNSNIIEGATSATYTATESGSYTVQVTGSCGKSSMSLPMEYTKEPNDKQNQTITFPTLANKTYGDPSFTLNATSTSDLPVTFSIVSGPATVSGSTLTLIGAGTVTVRASQAGNETYEAAPDVDRTFNVAKASQIITFSEILDKVVGDASFQVNASSTSGLTVSVSVVSGPATVANNVVSITGEGTVTLKASQSGNENYLAAIDVNRSFCVIPAKPTISNKEDLLTSSSQVGNQWYFNGNVIHGATSSTYIATESGSYTVQVTGSCGNSLKSEPMLYEKAPDTKQDQTIDFPSITNKTYGDPSFALSATSTSGLPVTFSIVSGPATLSGSSLTLTGAGTVTVRASQAGNETYEAAPDVDRTFNVAKASQIIIFTEIQDKAVGDAPFQVSASASSGLIVSLSIVSGPATITGNTVTLTGQEGTVTISARQLGSDNYLSAADVTKDFCVKPAKATITQSDNMLISSSAVGNQWYYNGLLLEGATSNTYLANKTGSYSVQLVGICGNSMSDPVNITIDTDPNTDDKIIAFPVPAKDVLNIIFPGKEKWTEVKLIDKEGKTWITAKPKSNGNQMMLKIDSLPRGVYIILINTKEATYRKTITIE